MNKLIATAIISMAFAITCTTNQTQAQVYFSYDFAGFGNFIFNYGSWTGNITPGASYVTVSGTANTSGGAGFSFAPLDLTITPPASTYLQISARLLPSHNGSALRLGLSNNPLNYSVWSLPAGLFNTSTFTTVQIPLSTAPVVNVGTLDLTTVATYQFQGNFFSPGNFAVEVESMSIIPEPKSVALVTATLLLFGIFVARRHMRKCASKLVVTA